MDGVQISLEQAYQWYPSKHEIDLWADTMMQTALCCHITGTFMEDSPISTSFGNGPNALVNRYIKFVRDKSHVFYGYWQPAFRQPAPLLVNLPGYGGCINLHPQLSDDGYNILHISPLGYVWPNGECKDIKQNNNWPVLQNTALGLPDGYESWLIDCVLAIRWTLAHLDILDQRVSLYGTSQGGGTALILASLLQNIRCVCADLPFLTAFPQTGLQGDAYGLLQAAFQQEEPALFWRRLGYIDTLSHTHRLHMPVMLSCAGQDTVCPPDTIMRLFDCLQGTKQLTFLKNGVHTHSRESMYLFRCWCSMYA